MTVARRIESTEKTDMEWSVAYHLNQLRERYSAEALDVENTRLGVLDRAAQYSSVVNMQNYVAGPQIAHPGHSITYDQLRALLSPDKREEILARIKLEPGQVVRSTGQVNAATMEIEGMNTSHLFGERGGVTSIVAWFPIGTNIGDVVAAWEGSLAHLKAATDPNKKMWGFRIEQAHDQNGNPLNMLCATVVLSNQNTLESWTITPYLLHHTN